MTPHDLVFLLGTKSRSRSSSKGGYSPNFEGPRINYVRATHVSGLLSVDTRSRADNCHPIRRWYNYKPPSSSTPVFPLGPRCPPNGVEPCRLRLRSFTSPPDRFPAYNIQLNRQLAARLDCPSVGHVQRQIVRLGHSSVAAKCSTIGSNASKHTVCSRLLSVRRNFNPIKVRVETLCSCLASHLNELGRVRYLTRYQYLNGHPHTNRYLYRIQMEFLLNTNVVQIYSLTWLFAYPHIRSKISAFIALSTTSHWKLVVLWSISTTKIPPATHPPGADMSPCSDVILVIYLSRPKMWTQDLLYMGDIYIKGNLVISHHYLCLLTLR